MEMPIFTGFVFGRLWALRRNVQSAYDQNRAGMLMALGGRANPALGLVLANESISEATVPANPSQSPPGQISTTSPPSQITTTAGSPAGTKATAPSGGDGSSTTTGGPASSGGSSNVPETTVIATIGLGERVQEMIAEASAAVVQASEAVRTAAVAQAESATIALEMYAEQSGGNSRSRRSGRSRKSQSEPIIE